MLVLVISEQILAASLMRLEAGGEEAAGECSSWKAAAACRDSMFWCRQETVLVRAASPQIISSLDSEHSCAFCQQGGVLEEPGLDGFAAGSHCVCAAAAQCAQQLRLKEERRAKAPLLLLCIRSW